MADGARQRSAPLSAAELMPAIQAVLDWLPVEYREQLAPYFTPSALRRRRDAERNACYRQLAASLRAESGRDLAEAVAAELGRYQHASWRFERGRSAPAEWRRAIMHRILTLDGGKILAPDSLRRVLAGVGAKKPDFLRQPVADNAPDDESDRA